MDADSIVKLLGGYGVLGIAVIWLARVAQKLHDELREARGEHLSDIKRLELASRATLDEIARRLAQAGRSKYVHPENQPPNGDQGTRP